MTSVEDAQVNTPAVTIAPVVSEEGLTLADSGRTEYTRMRLRGELEALSRGVLTYRLTDLLRKAILEGDEERARVIVEVAPRFFPNQAEELAELAREHLPDESEPGVREGVSYPDMVAEYLRARRKLQQSAPKRAG